VAVTTGFNDIAVVFDAANVVVITVVAAPVVDISLSCVVVVDVDVDGGAVADVAVVKFVADCDVSVILVVAVRFDVEFDFILNIVVVVLVFNIVDVVFSSVDVVKVVITVDTLVGNTVVDVVKAIVAVDNPAVVVISLICSLSMLSCSLCCCSLFSNPFSFPSTLVFFSFSSVSFFIFLLTSVSSRLSSPSGTFSNSFLSCL